MNKKTIKYELTLKVPEDADLELIFFRIIKAFAFTDVYVENGVEISGEENENRN
jgi:hypothetical protein